MPALSLGLVVCASMASSLTYHKLPDWWWITAFSSVYASPVIIWDTAAGPKGTKWLKTSGYQFYDGGGSTGG
jgi:hypothetical protein